MTNAAQSGRRNHRERATVQTSNARIGPTTTCLGLPSQSGPVTSYGSALAEQLQQLGLGEDRHLGLLRLRELRGARLLPDDETRRLRRDRAGDLGPERLEPRLCLLAGEALERARDDV